MAGSNTFSSNAPPSVTPQDCHVHQGAILWLPKQRVIDYKHGTPGHVRVLRNAGRLLWKRRYSTPARFAVVKGNVPAGYRDHVHPILVLSRPDEVTIEFVTVSLLRFVRCLQLILYREWQLRSYKDTALEKRFSLFKQSGTKHRAIVEHHLSISPAQHPLHSTSANGTYRALRLSDGLEMFYRSHVSVLPVFTMEWRLAERYFRKDQLVDMVSHWQLDGPSMVAVLDLARDKAQYVPGRQYSGQARI